MCTLAVVLLIYKIFREKKKNERKKRLYSPIVSFGLLYSLRLIYPYYINIRNIRPVARIKIVDIIFSKFCSNI